MMRPEELAPRPEALQELMQAKYRVKGRSFAQALRRTGRLLPRRQRREGEMIARAQFQAGHPRLARQIDREGVETACTSLAAFLKGVDTGARRREALLNLAALVAFYILLAVGGVLLFAWWQGTI